MRYAALSAALVFASVAHGQIKGTKAGSAEALQKVQDQRASLAPSVGLSVSGLKVGAQGRPTFLDAKVMQVLDDKRMLVGLEDARTNNGRYSTWVVVQCPTTGVTDGKSWRGGQWKKMTGGDVLKVTGTTTYETAAGGTRTVFVLEPVTADENPKKK